MAFYFESPEFGEGCSVKMLVFGTRELGRSGDADRKDTSTRTELEFLNLLATVFRRTFNPEFRKFDFKIPDIKDLCLQVDSLPVL